jgi:formylglycine-generating enzyme required for sulfatase activity
VLDVSDDLVGGAGTAGSGAAGAGGAAGKGGAGGGGGGGGAEGLGGQSGGTGSSGHAGASGASSSPCPTTPPAMVALSLAVTGAAGTLCIDTTEVTVAQWDAFAASLATATPKVPSTCLPSSLATRLDATGDSPNAGVRGVTWCGAAGYCAWAGKRLCGKIGAGAATFAHDYKSVTVDEWTFACTDGVGPALQPYPYGKTYDQAKCDAACETPSKCHPAAPGDYPGCVTKSGIRDLSGSVAEWSAVCDDATNPKECLFRGGDFGQNDGLVFRCDTAYGEASMFPKGAPSPVNEAPSGVGFRCCAYAP